MKEHFCGKYICRSIASNILILTTDNYYVLAKMSINTSLPNKIKFIGGAMSKDDLKENILDPFECVKREIYEEIGLTIVPSNKILPAYFITRKNLSFINTLYIYKTELSRDD